MHLDQDWLSFQASAEAAIRGRPAGVDRKQAAATMLSLMHVPRRVGDNAERELQKKEKRPLVLGGFRGPIDRPNMEEDLHLFAEELLLLHDRYWAKFFASLDWIYPNWETMP
jgi:hypothetical protein